MRQLKRSTVAIFATAALTMGLLADGCFGG